MELDLVFRTPSQGQGQAELCTIAVKVETVFTMKQTFGGASQVMLVVEDPPTNAGDVRDAGVRERSLGWEDPMEQGMATHSSILAWRIP